MQGKINMEKSAKKTRVAIAGSSGYTGLELLKILLRHTGAEVTIAISGTYGGTALNDAFPSFNAKHHALNSKSGHIKFKSYDEIGPDSFSGIDVVFLCLPAARSMEFVKKYLAGFAGAIIDIGSDFRLNDPDSYVLWYGQEHVLPELLDSFIYGLPELNGDKIKSSRYIANPGCYPTSVLLALAPVFAAGCFEISAINIDSKSGVSGAGRKLKDQYLFYSLNDNFYAYSTLMHRHIGEIEQELSKMAGSPVKVCFTPHLLPVDRGIFSTIYCSIGMKNQSPADLQKSVLRPDDAAGNTGPGGKDYFKDLEEKLESSFSSFYECSTFVKFTGKNVPQLKDVAGTNMCMIGYALDIRTGLLKIFSTIDNLLKGAAGQAVQNMNIMFGYNQEEGLI